MLCVFYRPTVLDMVILLLWSSLLNIGVPSQKRWEISGSDDATQKSKRKSSSGEDISDGLKLILEYFATSLSIKLDEGKKPNHETAKQFDHFSVSDKFLAILARLMELEQKLISNTALVSGLT